MCVRILLRLVTRVDGEAVTRNVFFATDETWIAACR
jgi:hypothetical protein